MRRLRLLPLTLTLLASAALADEGMWTFDNFPAERMKKAYGFAPDQAWLDKVQLASARLAGGCSASFVSPEGLVLTNHHCARRCIADLSTAKKDFAKNGFMAKTRAQELKCPGMEVNKLLQIRDVTAEVAKATAGLSGEKYNDAQKATFARLEKGCATAENLRCDVVSLYNGGQYHLYKYQRFQDTRLVFAPETAIAFFGGDPDNFEFPRYTLDLTFLRVYEDGKPAKTEQYFKWSKAGAKEGEVTFITGNPGTTRRLDTVAELTYARDFALPERLMQLAELRGALEQYRQRGAEQSRTSEGLRFGIDNSFKALRGRREALVDADFFAKLAAQEKTLREKVRAKPEWQSKYGAAWDAIAQATARGKELRHEVRYLGGGVFGSTLMRNATSLVRAADERLKPNEERLPEYADARLPYLEQQLTSAAPIYVGVEEIAIATWLSNMRADLGPDHPAVRDLLGNKSPEQLARELTRSTRLTQPAVRKGLYTGGAKAIAASKDPLIQFARKLDPVTRAVRKRYETEVESVIKKNSELVAQARFAVYGTSTYPDATFTARLSYGSVKGLTDEGKRIEPFTVIAGTFPRATGQDPFKLPPSWLKSKDKLDGNVPFNFLSNNDIIGGNSGSPVINRDAEIVGLVFDGNIHSLGGEYGFDEKLNRAVSVHSAGMVEALRTVYGATGLLQELGVPAK